MFTFVPLFAMIIVSALSKQLLSIPHQVDPASHRPPPCLLSAYIESAAIQIGSDILELSSWGEYSLNGVAGAELPKMMADMYPMHYEMINKKRHEIDIALGHNATIKLSTFKDLVAVSIKTAHEEGILQVPWNLPVARRGGDAACGAAGHLHVS